ncbi:uncharacterized protein Dana_GF18185 [Drosophila ananassae]|uniref:Transcription factor Ouib n=1 Tax=Drosophila ananassae TaxID=7217 RepID=B3LXH0_DROAN|nr:transcription factor Ouib [Drosophila ananassae]EDV42814.1 uncharacterized protein Dana_GF18185 [Drosophila ananassae]
MLVNRCRTCGISPICGRSLNLFAQENKKLLMNLNLVTGLQLEEIPNVSNFICLRCQSDLRSTVSFRRLCIKSFRKCTLIDKDPSSSEPETENLKDESKLQGEEGTRTPEETFQVLIEVDPENHNLIFDSAGEEQPLSVAPKSESMETRREYNQKRLPRKVRNPNLKSKTVNQIFICELCGHHATSKSNFDRHILKHTGERPFACEECGARFRSAAEQREHRRVHTKDRPFGCRFCDRKYVSYMGRLKHERTHTNDRPFVCVECGKTFADTYVLKNHMLIHSGERQFECELCDRSFQRKTHLLTHYRSKLHQNNLKIN